MIDYNSERYKVENLSIEVLSYEMHRLYDSKDNNERLESIKAEINKRLVIVTAEYNKIKEDGLKDTRKRIAELELEQLRLKAEHAIQMSIVKARLENNIKFKANKYTTSIPDTENEEELQRIRDEEEQEEQERLEAEELFEQQVEVLAAAVIAVSLR